MVIRSIAWFGLFVFIADVEAKLSDTEYCKVQVGAVEEAMQSKIARGGYTMQSKMPQRHSMQFRYSVEMMQGL
jgi:hypothetical protein